MNIFVLQAPQGGPALRLPSLETTLPTRRDVVESRAAGNTASRAASRVTQKIRAIRLAGKKKCAQGLNRFGRAVHKSSLVDSSEAEIPGSEENLGGWRMGFNGPPVTHGLPSLCSQS